MGSFFDKLIEGLRLFKGSFGNVRHMKFVYPVIIIVGILFFFGSLSVGSFASEYVGELLGGFFASSDFLPEVVESVLGVVANVAVRIMTFIAFGVINGSIILVVLSPLWSIVADKAWVAEGGNIPSQGFVDILKSVWRGILVSIKYLVLQMIILLACFLLSLVPLIGLVAPFLTVAVNAYFYGATYADYATERAGLDSSGSVKFASENKGLMVGIGLPFAIALLIPFLGTYLALFVAPVVCIAGAKGTYKYTVHSPENGVGTVK